MKQLYSLLLIILFLGVSCNKTKKTQEVSVKIDSLTVSDNRIVSVINEILRPTAKKEISTWQEYKNLDEFIIKYYNISNTEALNKAEELVSLIQLMKDTIRVEKLKGLNIKARFNVLHNEALRLQDMATISSITTDEVKEEVTKIIELYSALNSKINTIYKADELQKSLEIDTETPIEIIEDELIPSDEVEGRMIKPVKRDAKKRAVLSKKL